MPRLSRLFQPASIVVFGSGWAENVIAQCQKMGFSGDIWPVHPKRKTIAGVPCFASVAALPGVPDAAFLGINRDAVIEVTKQLAAIGCGGAVCFASGFAEAGQLDRQQQLVAAAGDMPILGPNCYGFINYLDGALLWPDQHGGRRCTKGVALISQSSNIAINLGMQARGLPVGYVGCVGNQAQTSLTDMAAALLEDPRITAAGLYIEGIHDAGEFAKMAYAVRQNGKYIVAIKAGKTAASQQAAGAHTAALAGDAAASSAFLRQCGVIEVDSLDALIETLKILHLFGALPGNRISALCCSGGEAGLLADMAVTQDLSWPELPEYNASRLADKLGPLVHLANPLDYHTFIWGDEPAMTECFANMMGDWVDLCCLVIDFPRADRCSRDAWMPAVAALQTAASKTGTKAALLASLPEGMPDDIASWLMDEGLLPLCGFEAGLAALTSAANAGRNLSQETPWVPLASIASSITTDSATTLIDEAGAKAVLRANGIACPAGITGDTPGELAHQAVRLTPPLALKGMGTLHKSEQGFVTLGLAHAELAQQAKAMTDAQRFLVEEMVTAPVAELLVGLRRDPQYGIHLTIASGGIMTELCRDSQSLILPASRTAIAAALGRLQFAALLNGFRGRPAADQQSAIDQILALCQLITNDHSTAAIEINPLIITTNSAIAADALLWRYNGIGNCRNGSRAKHRSFSMTEVIHSRTDGGILEVTLDRPKANAIDLATSRQMGDVFQSFRDDAALRVCILRTAGEKFFSAGWDLKAAAAGDSVTADYGVGGFAGLQELRDLNKPVIAAVEGMCVGGGFELALSCDLILATAASSFALPEIRAGTLADAATIKLPKRIPYHVAMDLLLTGRWMDSAEAHRWGLVNEIFADADALYDRAWALAKLLESGPPLVFAAIKEVAREAEAMKFQDILNKVTKMQLPTVDRLYNSEDGVEGFRAFAEKRDPVWRGR